MVDVLASRLPTLASDHHAHQLQTRTELQGGVLASVNYSKPDPKGEQLYEYMYLLPDGTQPTSDVPDGREVLIRDIRTSAKDFRLDSHGFQLETLRLEGTIDWDDDQQVKDVYYTQAAQLIQRVSGATRVHIFNHTVRRGSSRDPNGQPTETTGTPVAQVHVDYTIKSGSERLHMVMDKKLTASLVQTPFAVIQLWRPLQGPVEESPLALIDAQTVAKADLMDLRLEWKDRTGWNYAVKYNPGHHWYYVRGMRTDEALLFKCYDSRDDRSRFTPHTGFTDPTTRPDAPPRQSIEIRAYVFWEDLPPQPIAMQL